MSDALSARPQVSELARTLRDTHLPRLGAALAILPPGDLWWRPHAGAISVGTVLLHLEGNVRQWICAGIGGAPDARDRAAEFAAVEGPERAELFQRLTAAVAEACRVIEGLDAAALARTYRIQGFEVAGFAAALHVVEHFAWHTGQAVWIAKARAGAGHGLAFYDDARVNAARNG